MYESGNAFWLGTGLLEGPPAKLASIYFSEFHWPGDLDLLSQKLDHPILSPQNPSSPVYLPQLTYHFLPFVPWIITYLQSLPACRLPEH